MSDTFKPYPEYKDSGLQWLGHIPTHWNLRRAKYLMQEINSRSTDGGGTLLSVSQYTGVTKRRSRQGSDGPDTRSSSLVGYKIAKSGDLVSNIMLAWNGSLGIAPIEGVVSPAYSVYRIHEDEPWFFHHLLRSPIYKAEIKRRSRGVVESRLRLYTDDLFRIPILLPDLEEQQAIVRFVRNLDRRVTRFIRNRRRLIEALNDQKQAIINRAVTRGLDTNAPMKPSGVDWLADIPAHWDMKRAKYLLREIKCRSIDGSETLLRVSQYSGITLRTANDATGMPRAESLVGYKCVQPRDFVVNIMVAWNGSFGVSNHEGLVSPAYCVYRFSHELNPWYYHYLLRTPSYLYRIKSASTGVIESRLRLYSDDLGRIEMLVPPLAEQIAISEQVEQDTRSLNSAIAKSNREIDLIREYRTRLIADVVTGKLDVRHLAPPSGSEDLEEAVDEIEPQDDVAGEVDEEALAGEVEA